MKRDIREVMMGTKSNQIQALRGIAFLGVFLSHTGLKWFGAAGHWGVSIFLVLSGFLMFVSYSGNNRIERISIRDNIAFSWGKIKKLYPLHICTMVFMMLFAFVGGGQTSWRLLILKVGINVAMLQEWLPIKNISINGVSWYLAAAMLCYFIFPFALTYISKIQSRTTITYIIAGTYLLQIFSSYFLSFLPTVNGGGIFLSNMSEWAIYFFPPIRILDFLIGCCAGCLYINRNQPSQSQQKIELFVVTEIVIANILCVMYETHIINVIGEASGSYLWWTYSIPFTLSSATLVYLLMEKQSPLGKMITNNITIFLGNISGTAFLIHYVVFQYMKSFMCTFISRDFYDHYGGWLRLTIGFVITIVLTLMWIKLENKSKRKRTYYARKKEFQENS